MGTRADFYIGEGTEAIWLGSISSDGFPETFSLELLTASSESDFLGEFRSHISSIKNFKNPNQGWPWKWDTSQMTDYTFAFINNQVMISIFGSSWITVLEYFQKKELINDLEDQLEKSNGEQFDIISLKIEQLQNSFHTNTKIVMPNMRNKLSQRMNNLN